MTTHLALLRGINVSGHNMIKMEALKTTLEAVGFQNVQTVGCNQRIMNFVGFGYSQIYWFILAKANR